MNKKEEVVMKKNMLACLVMAVVVLGGRVWAADWETDFAKASTNAAKTGAYMLLDFSGSDWCGWCIKLDKEVFSKPEFKAYAKTNLVCVLLDFPREKHQSKKLKEQNSGLAGQYGIRGYPSVIVLSPAGELVGQTGYQPGGPKAYVEHLKTMINAHKSKQPKKAAEPVDVFFGKPEKPDGK